MGWGVRVACGVCVGGWGGAQGVQALARGMREGIDMMMHHPPPPPHPTPPHPTPQPLQGALGEAASAASGALGSAAEAARGGVRAAAEAGRQLGCVCGGGA